jgi:hypothetical protein
MLDERFGPTLRMTWAHPMWRSIESESSAAVAVTGFGAEREARGRPVMENRHDPLRDAAGPERPSLG